MLLDLFVDVFFFFFFDSCDAASYVEDGDMKEKSLHLGEVFKLLQRSHECGGESSIEQDLALSFTIESNAFYII